MKANVTVTISNLLKASATTTNKNTLKSSVNLNRNSNSFAKYDHSILNNLDYETSGHTGFASQKELNERLANLKPTAGQVYFTDGQTLEEKYMNGELGGGGGGSFDDTIILSYITDTNINVATGETATIKYNFAREVNTTRTGLEKVYVNGKLVSTKNISQGDNEVILNLEKGTHSITIEVISSNLVSSLIYNVEVIELSISSSFDGFSVYGGDIVYRYTPVGNVKKTVYFKVDGETHGTAIVTESGKTMTYELTGLTHGSHSLEVYLTAEINKGTSTSNKLKYDLLVNNGGTDTIIACPFKVDEATQGDLLTFDYLVCNPSSLTANVTLLVNDEVVSELNVDRTKQVWSIRNYPVGETTFTISSGGISKSFVVQVAEADIEIEAVSHNLELYLTANGRNNNEAENVRNVWKNNGISAEFTNFNWKSNGWIVDNEGNTALRVNGDALVNIPLKLFAEDFRSIGKTIEFEFSTKDIRNYDSILINCLSNDRGFSLTSNIARLNSEQSAIETKFKEDEKVRVAFVIEPTTENRLIYTYVNGIISGLAQYPSDDNFSQSTPIGITIGSPNATIDIYNIRVYNINLDHSDILNNYIADTVDTAKKAELYSSNNIFDSYGNINYEKVLKYIPCLTLIGELPGSKGDKKIVDIKYVNAQDSTKDFTSSSATLDIQGTSSQYYPRKNYKFKLGIAYKLTDTSIAEKVFCLKADYMETSHSHNTGLAKIVNTLYPKTPASEVNNKVQSAITGFPIVVWHQADANAELVCLGVYNFNNDKDDVTTFGYTSDFPNCESWEFKNNTSAHCLFQNDNFVDTTEVAKNFEARYPDKYTNYTNLSRVVSWVASTQNDLEKFKNEFESYFNLEATLLYYCLTELFAMVDSRAKNLFLTTWDGSIWYPTFYDMDTAFGLNNEGVNDFDYSVEYHDTQGSQNVFNGEASVLWNNFEEAFEDEIAEFYINLRNNDKVTYDSVMDILYGEQISKISENNYNYDAIEKYKNPLVEDGIGTYLYVAQGSRLEHLKRWLHNRFNYMDSKYVASEFKEDYLTLRIYTPEEYGSILPNADIHITPYTDQYVAVKYDENMFSTRGKHNEETVIDAPNQVFNDTPLIVYGAKGISSIGDLSPLYAGTVDVSKGIKLKQLIVGNSASDYSNTNLKVLTIGNNELLTKLDVRNCPSLTQAIDASGCTNIEEIYATGTSTTAIKVPNGGNLKKLHLPNTITNLTILNQPFISEFVCGSFENVSTLRIENSSVDSLEIVQDALTSGKLTRVRLLNVDWETTDETLLSKLMLCGGLDENGLNQTKSVLTGKIHIKGSIASDELEDCNAYWGSSLVITADRIVPKYKCYFYNYDGTLLYTTSVGDGKYATYNGETPTRENDGEYSYEFSGWSPNPETTIITSETNFTAQYTATELLSVNWVNYNGVILQTDKVSSGSVVSYTSGTPTKPDDVQYKNNVFNGWLGSDGNTYVKGSSITITEDLTLIAQYTGTLQTYTVYWYNGDELLGSQVEQYGTVAEYIGDTPVSEDGYSFVGWSKTPNSSAADTDFTITGETYFYAAFDQPDTLVFKVTSSFSPALTLASCTGADEEITIDWGQGNVTTYTVTTSGTKCQCPIKYSTSTINTIKLPATENYKITKTSSFWDSYMRFISASFKYLRIDTSGLFKNSDSLTSVSLGNVSSQIGITTLSGNTFIGCSNLTSFTIPEGVTIIGMTTFSGCTSLTSITIPNSVTSIYTFAFEDCTSLTNITIPSSVTNIGGSAFSGCSNLTSVTVLSTTPPTVGTSIFLNCSALEEIIVPKGTLEAYQSSTNWSAYADIMVEASE